MLKNLSSIKPTTNSIIVVIIPITRPAFKVDLKSCSFFGIKIENESRIMIIAKPNRQVWPKEKAPVFHWLSVNWKEYHLIKIA